jgi:hypothetical protein
MVQTLMSSWRQFEQECQYWKRAGESLSLWWRDDDANQEHQALSQLVALARKRQIPLALATVPYQVDPFLRELVADAPLSILQHGYQHLNFAPANEKKQELGLHRDPGVIEKEITQGKVMLQDLFDGQFVPVMVPPWNRIARELLVLLKRCGFAAVSCYGVAQNSDFPLPRINTHVDIIDFRAGRKFLGTEAVLELLLAHLRARRLGEIDKHETTGLLSHHLDHDSACWDFCEELFNRSLQFPCVHWCSVDRLLQ